MPLSCCPLSREGGVKGCFRLWGGSSGGRGKERQVTRVAGQAWQQVQLQALTSSRDWGGGACWSRDQVT